MDADEAYRLLQNLASPVVGITCRRGEKLNGFIVNSAIRASLVPGRQHVAHYTFKRHLSHEIIAATGEYAVHLLADDQWEEIHALGFRSGRETEKLDGLEYRISDRTDLPLLTRSVAWMECRVVNAMDAGASTFFLAEITRTERGSGETIMESDYFRENMPEAWRDEYYARREQVQSIAAGWPAEMDDRTWRELHERARTTAG